MTPGHEHEDAETAMAIEEREAELGYYSDAAWRYREQADDCEHAVWNPDNRQCLDCGHISPEDLPPAPGCAS